MAGSTTNISLIKPEITDATVIRTIYNTNLDTIDGRFSATYMAVQAKNAVDIDGGSITGITDLAIADGGTASSNAGDARTALGLVIGTNVQAYDAGLLSIAGLTTAANKMIYTTASDTYAVADLSAFGRTIIDDADASAVRTTIGAQSILTNEAGLYGALSDVSDFVQGAEANSIDSVMYVDASIDHEHLAPDVISGMTNVASVDADYILIWDATDSALKKCDMAEVRNAGGGFVDISGTPVDNDFAKFTDNNTIEGRSYLQTRYDLNNYVVYPQDYGTGTGTSIDPWTGISSAYTACATNGTIYCRRGYYVLSTYLTIAKSINIVGEGMNKTFIVTANAIGFKPHANYITIMDMTIDGDAQTDGTAYLSCIKTDAQLTHFTVRNVEVKNAGYYGINNFECNYSVFENVYAHDCYHGGIHPACNTVGWNKWNIYRDNYAWNNTDYGWADRGDDGNPNEYTFNIYDNIQSWDNGTYGIQIAYQRGCVISNCVTYSNGSIGLEVLGVDEFNIHNCNSYLNDREGISIKNSINVNCTDIIVKNNNVDDVASLGGIKVEGSTKINLNSCQSFDDRGTMLQNNGLRTVGTCDVDLVNCILLPNTAKITNSTASDITFIDAHDLTADHDYSGRGETDKVGETVVFGELLYFNWTDKEWKKTDADAAATMPGLRIALEGKANGQKCLMLVQGDIRDDSAFAFAGSMVYASCTPGDITSTAPSASGDQIQRVGQAKSADILFFSPSNDVGEI